MFERRSFSKCKCAKKTYTLIIKELDTTQSHAKVRREIRREMYNKKKV